ncbi:MAG: diguanylate cyclase, partial [Chloroflexi bacterium]|nr:diguanylate cyclase [Chloroflexota bacterium]
MPVERSFAPVRVGGHTIGIAVEFRDRRGELALLATSEDRATELEEKNAELELYQQMFRAVDTALLIVQDDRVCLTNHALRGRIGFEVLDVPVREIIVPEDVDHVLAILNGVISGKLEQGTAEYRVRTADGELVTLEGQARRIEYRHRPAAVVTVLDITARKRAEEALRDLSLTDALTGLANRRHLAKEISDLPLATGTAHALLFVDLDRFKTVNDLHGHEAGDRALRAVAAALMTVVRPGDLVARVGGDEFAILLRDAGIDGASLVVTRAIGAVRAAVTP